MCSPPSQAVGECRLAGEQIHCCCLLTAEDRICVLQDLPVALLLGQRLATSVLAKSKAKPHGWFLLIVSPILFCPLYSSGFIGLH